MRRAFSFLTVLGRGTAPDGATLRWFPVVGLVLGAAVGGVWWGADRVLPPLVAAGVVVLVDLALTGMLHVDGLADSADGLLPHRQFDASNIQDVDLSAPQQAWYGDFDLAGAYATLWGRG